MFKPRASLTATLLATVSMATVLCAQSPVLTNADVARLVAMHVSDQTVTAVIHEAAATQVDLKPLTVDELTLHGISSAVIAVMRQSSIRTQADTIAAPAQWPAHPQTLAEASEAAKGVTPNWPQPMYTQSSSAPGLPAPTITSEGAKSEGTIIATTVKDEGWWRTRMGGLRDQLAIDKTACEPLAAKILALQSTYDSYVFVDRNGASKINTAAASVIETKLVDARTEQRQCVAKVALDQTAIGAAEEEADALALSPVGFADSPT